jgi:hypothetical protein
MYLKSNIVHFNKVFSFLIEHTDKLTILVNWANYLIPLPGQCLWCDMSKKFKIYLTVLSFNLHIIFINLDTAFIFSLPATNSKIWITIFYLHQRSLQCRDQTSSDPDLSAYELVCKFYHVIQIMELG